MRLFLLFIFALFSNGLFTQYSTPGTGVIWDIDDLVANSGGSVQSLDVGYLVTEDVIISIDDHIIIDHGPIRMASDITVTVHGGFDLVDITIFTDIFNLTFDGFRFEEGSSINLNNVGFYNCGGFKVITDDFIMENCTINECPSIITTGAMIELSNGKPIIRNNTFEYNEVSAISSAANSSVAPVIEGNLIDSNVLLNDNRPQINLGPSGQDTTYLIDNVILGSDQQDMSGGIAFSSLVAGEGHVVIRNNEIRDNRYGIAIIGNGLTALIEDNIISDNNVQNEPLLGGSGINLNGNSTSFAIISNNDVRNNLWGVTIQGSFLANLGDVVDNIDSPGLNVFAENGNEGELYALFNNTPNDVPAMFNCWNDTLVPLTSAIAESVISHEFDDPELGEVLFNPLGECFSVGINEFVDLSALVDVFPNPANGFVNFTIQNNRDVSQILLIDLFGRTLQSWNIRQEKTGILEVSHSNPGLYLISFISEVGIITKKLTLQ